MSMSENERWYWLEKKRRKRKIKHLNNNHRVEAVPSSPPLRWSSASLTCPFISPHDFHRNCIPRKWKWSKSNASTILMHHNEQILFHPRRSSSTQAILADRPLPSYGKFYWEIFVPAVYGTSIMFGIATNQQKLISENFTDLIGADQHGWGLSHHGLLWHHGKSRVYLEKSFELFEPILVGLQFDADARTLSYIINNQPMGIAFHSIPRNLPIYPAVSSTSAQSTMLLKHACQICSSLRELCFKTIKSTGLINKINLEGILPSHLIATVI